MEARGGLLTGLAFDHEEGFRTGMRVNRSDAALSADSLVDPQHPQPARSTGHDGVYRFTRNPMYSGHLIFMLGLTITFASLAVGQPDDLLLAKKRLRQLGDIA